MARRARPRQQGKLARDTKDEEHAMSTKLNAARNIFRGNIFTSSGLDPLRARFGWLRRQRAA
jgi:hypothetical protein